MPLPPFPLLLEPLPELLLFAAFPLPLEAWPEPEVVAAVGAGVFVGLGVLVG